MRLQQIDILGFKSFRDRATISLSDGMTVVVGPNGCGKSNVVDAIKWAMGDMSAKSLRGQSMEDVIFAGSEHAKPMGLADVTLTFENTGLPEDVQWGEGIPREFRTVSEIAVTRRLHRSGESEYLINKVPCRLLDIQNLLAGTGLGKQGYSIIEQNRVGFIVSAKPSERRLLIEEASGITRYKGQRDRTMRRLSKAEENLLRVTDILGEVVKQLRGLERQARRAGQHRRFTEEFLALEIGLLQRRLQAHVARRSELDVAGALAEQVFGDSRGGLSRTEGELESGRVALLAADKKNAATTEAFYRAETQATLGATRLEHADSMFKDLESRVEEKTRDEDGQRERRERLDVELATLTETLGAFSKEDEDTSLEQEERELSVLRLAAEAAASALQGHRAEFDRLRAEFHRGEDRKGWLKDQLVDLDERESESALQQEQFNAEIRQWEARADEGRRLISSATEILKQTQENQRVALEARRDLQQVSVLAQQRFDDSRQQEVRVSAELETLKDLRDRGEGYGDSVKSVMAWAAKHGRTDVVGPIADVVEANAEEQQILAQILGEGLSDIVVRNVKAAQDAIASTQPKSRTVFRVCAESPLTVSGLLGSVERAEELIQTDGRGTWALDSGVTVRGTRIFSGEEIGEAASALDRNRRIQDLGVTHEERIEAATLAAEVSAVAQMHLGKARDHAEEIRSSIENANVEVRTAERQLESDSREADRVRSTVKRLQGQLVPLLRRQSDCRNELEQLLVRQTDHDGRVVRLREGLEGKESASVEARNAFDIRREVLLERRVEQAKRAERHRNLVDSRDRVARGIASADSLIQRGREERAELRSRMVSNRAEAAAATSSIALARRNLDICQQAMKVSGQEAARARQAVQVLELKVRTARAELEGAQKTVQELAVQRREAVMGVEHVRNQLIERFEVEEPEQALAIAESIEIPEGEWPSRRDYLRKRLDSMGPVNAMAEKEYQEALERETFLSEQNDDLERSISDLKRAISEMDRESRRRFKETFEAVNAKFQEVFPRLFRGGEASLTLTDPDDLLHTGVDIDVCPPGKKLQNVMLLSGGEKALTAVSLVFSIFMLKPTPFAVLDEVDAPLDEANVGRFARLVHEMSETSQMIVITHSRRTMESADVLYGVTMQQAGVSKLVSVKLSELDDRKAS